ncbi:protein of unknown function [Gracilibacillus ureilyticus]|uniref:DUF4349 domain-containing protein n=1 Tax=Gracilibacillus ureilyticus TaxID=531814 RepID=A0A1H9NMU4_9BACI|nr:DUF4349 domain-containing protein [Gracilibacillus ureilyticus]SER36959.1 protein of unknown function [Gracilibacillus ureilyticus]
MNKKRYLIILCIFIAGLGACSYQDTEDSTSEATDSKAANEESADNTLGEGTSDNEITTEYTDTSQEEDDQSSISERKIVYHATLQLETSSYSETTALIEEETNKADGYIVTSETYGNESENDRNGTYIVRIPSSSFQSFLTIFEKGDLEVTEKSVRGKDVTEQYVDLNARLKSKKVVEQRLLSFMENAEKTEDLLTISADLAAVQEEIEQLTGKINYLENQSSYATIEIYISEEYAELPSVQKETINTWEKAADQFKQNINILISAASAIFVFLAGNAPIIFLLGIISAIIVWFTRKMRRTKRDH